MPRHMASNSACSRRRSRITAVTVIASNRIFAYFWYRSHPSAVTLDSAVAADTRPDSISASISTTVALARNRMPPPQPTKARPSVRIAATLP